MATVYRAWDERLKSSVAQFGAQMVAAQSAPTGLPRARDAFPEVVRDELPSAA
jgi:hypothetical protein